MKRLLAIVILLGTSQLYSMSQYNAFQDFLNLSKNLPQLSSDFYNALAQAKKQVAKINRNNPGPWAQAQLNRLNALLKPVMDHILSKDGELMKSLNIVSQLGVKQAADLKKKLNKIFTELQASIKLLEQAENYIK